MQLDYQNNTNQQIALSPEENVVDLLKKFLNELGEPISKDDFTKELESYNQYKIQNTANNFVDICKNVVTDDFNKTVIDIVAKVVSVNDDGTINVVKPYDTDINHSWTNIPNPTIYTNLKAGDEVLLRCIQKNQKSNMWVVSAKISYENFEDRTIFSNINAIFDLSSNIQLLKKWMNILK